ncbi:MAG: ParB/RepB/Spo0J family partition protein [Candidatus Izimaplasma sp.]|nr:ParB/RepB/Spo0J family partition protein [Candidatus Izimaplasma bacterium]
MKDNYQKSNLGRSFSDLIAENETYISSNEEIVEIPIKKIKANPGQPRTVFDEIKLKELANSIKEHGILQPVILKPATDGFILVAGERRVKAAEIAELDTVSAIVREYNEKYLPELAMLENIQREDLSPIEEAIAFQKIIENTRITHKELGKKIGKSRVYVTNIVGLLNLPTIVIEGVNSDKISMGHARALSKLKDTGFSIQLFDRIIAENLTVRDVEEIIRQRHNKNESYISKATLNQAKQFIQKRFNDIKVSVKPNRIIIKYDTEEQLKKILKKFKDE